MPNHVPNSALVAEAGQVVGQLVLVVQLVPPRLSYRSLSAANSMASETFPDCAIRLPLKELRQTIKILLNKVFISFTFIEHQWKQFHNGIPLEYQRREENL